MYKDRVSGWNLRNQMSPTFHFGIQEFEEFTAPTQILPQVGPNLDALFRSPDLEGFHGAYQGYPTFKISRYDVIIHIYISIYVISRLFLFHVFSVLWSQISQRKKQTQQFPMASNHQWLACPVSARK